MSPDLLVIANDVLPGSGLPTAAPGLRASGLAWGLRDHGIDVTVALDRRPLARASRGNVPPPRVPGTVRLEPPLLGAYIRTHRPKAVVITNSNQFDHLDLPDDVQLIYDFFAPKLLELQAEERPGLQEAVEALKARKARALARADLVISNGAKKLDYIRDQLVRAGRDPDQVPIVNVPTPLAPLPPMQPKAGPIQAIVAGYFQPWSTPAQWAFELEPLLADGRLTLHVLLADHWGGQSRVQASEAFRALLELPHVVRHHAAEYGDFRDLLRRCDVSIDVFERNPERELAMVTRTLVALSCGVPVVHVPFTETGALIAKHGGGWLVDEKNPASVREVLDNMAVTDRGAAKRAEAHAFAWDQLAPAAAVRPLVHVLKGSR